MSDRIIFSKGKSCGGGYGCSIVSSASGRRIWKMFSEVGQRIIAAPQGGEGMECVYHDETAISLR